ncbi:MAG: 30S ribosomal protein S4 [Candidatus Magasanikbacteria bacterium]|nr:30S ribosomal protein S4 [Candidatus Magasanikbacteria bacterium]
MGRYIGPTNKIARRFGVNLGLKTNAAKVARRLSQPPGVHGAKRRPGAATSFGKQLLEKQKAKFVYGLRERQFRNYVREATSEKGDSGLGLQRLLEQRLDNVVYRLGLASTRAQARQLVGHGMFLVNGVALNIPSYQVRVGDVVVPKPTKLKKKYFADMTEVLAKKQLPSWLTLDPAAMTGKVVSEPGANDFDAVCDVKLIIEFYSSR